MARVYAQQEDHRKASELFDQKLNYKFHAAQQALLAHEHQKAAQHLLGWLNRDGKRANRFLRGLTIINLGEAYLLSSERPKGMRYMAEANQLLEEEANAQEQKGHREKAYRCYQAIVHLGIVAKSNEALMEGGLNCIRISKENNERFKVMRQYYDLIRHSEDMHEWRVAAELYQEAGDYATRVSFIYGDWFWNEAGNAWMRVAQNHMEQGAPIDMVENALISAGNCFNHTGHMAGLVSTYSALASLELPQKSQEKYQRIMAHLADAPQTDTAKPAAFPEHFRRSRLTTAFRWNDLLQLDLKETPLQTIAGLLRQNNEGSQVQKRRALVFLMRTQKQEQLQTKMPFDLLSLLTQINHPLAWSPMLHIWKHGELDAKLALLSEATRHFKLPGLIELTQKGLTAPQPALREAAIKSISGIQFPQALDGLVELANQQTDLHVKKACFLSIAKIGTDAATEFLLDVMRTENGDIADTVHQLLMENPQERMLSALDRNLKKEPSPAMRTQINGIAENIRQNRTGIR